MLGALTGSGNREKRVHIGQGAIIRAPDSSPVGEIIGGIGPLASAVSEGELRCLDLDFGSNWQPRARQREANLRLCFDAKDVSDR